MSAWNADAMSCIVRWRASWRARGRRARRRGRIRGRLAGAPRVAVGHHHDHRLGLALGDQVVEDEVGAPLPDPAGLVLAAAVLQVEHGIARPGLRVVAGGQVDQRVPPRPGRLRRVPDLADLSVRHVLDRVVVGARLRHLDGARVLAPAEERMAARVGELRAVDDHRVVVQAGNERRRDHRPEPVRLLLHVDLRPAPEVHPGLGGIGRLDADLDPAGAVHAGILGAPHVGLGRLELTGLLRRTDRRHRQQRQRESQLLSSSAPPCRRHPSEPGRAVRASTRCRRACATRMMAQDRVRRTRFRRRSRPAARSATTMAMSSGRDFPSCAPPADRILPAHAYMVLIAASLRGRESARGRAM